ncbi:MAG TPA: response regulator [Chthoniobacterales bacterium]|nr:response regulator [Chthoniobacterales bacterium]
MPARRKSAAADMPPHNILLLEEYDALAAAISSALKKFAPQHARIVARSLAEAEKLASDLDPELFIVDVDPPWAGLTNFLEKMRAAHPNARALVIGTAIPAEIAAERRASGALQFIEKPFDLGAFGAAVQALLGPWREQEGRGTLGALDAIDVVLSHCAANSSVILDLRAGTRTGEIHIAGGQVLHAVGGKLKGEDALREMLNWSKPRLGEKKLSGSGPRTIANWQAIVVEALREPGAEVSEARPPETEIVSARPGKRIVVVDDTEMLLIFVEDILATADPKLQITTALSATEGLREIERLIPDLILLDYSLPDFNGDELCERLLENERTAHVPVLLMSGHVLEMNAAAARLPNVVAKIEKPFLSDAFVDLVQRTLETEHTFEKQTEKETLAPTIFDYEPTPPSPPKEEISIERQSRAVPPTTLAPAESHIEYQTPTGPPTIRVAPTDGNGAVLDLFLEVVSMQLTPQLQMGAIRARPASLTASLRLQSAAARNAIPAELGFQLGPAKLNVEGRISTLRLVPTSKPFQPAQMRTAFEIGGVALIPDETRARVQLTPAGTTPMTMELRAHLELNAVELTPRFQVAQLILNWSTNAVRVTLNPKAPEQTAAKFALRVVKLDQSGRIAELLLQPSK